MVRTTWIFALVFVVLGVALYLGTGRESVTALIPAFIGVLLAVCAWIGGRGEKARKHAMHVAVVLALIGFGGSAGGLIAVLKSLGGATLERPEAAYGRAAMAVLCVIYVGLGIRSFIQARRARQG